MFSAKLVRNSVHLSDRVYPRYRYKSVPFTKLGRIGFHFVSGVELFQGSPRSINTATTAPFLGIYVKNFTYTIFRSELYVKIFKNFTYRIWWQKILLVVLGDFARMSVRVRQFGQENSMFFAVNGLKSSKISPAGHMKPYDLSLMISYFKIEVLLVTNSPEGRKFFGWVCDKNRPKGEKFYV